MDRSASTQRPTTCLAAFHQGVPNSRRPLRPDRFTRLVRAGSATLALALLVGTSAAPGPEGVPPPEWVKASFIGSAFVLSFLPETPDWVAVDWTDNAVAWQELVAVAATSTATVYADLEAPSRPHRLYRLRSPGTRADEAARKWEMRSQRNYRFHLDRIGSIPPFLMQANVEIRSGEKTLTEVISDGLPVADGDPEYFPGIEELFLRLDQARADGARQVWASYTPSLGYLSRCTLDLRGLETGSVDGGALVQYRISNLIVLAE